MNKVWKVVNYANGSMRVLPSCNFKPYGEIKVYRGGRKKKVEGRMLTYDEHLASLKRHIKDLFRLDYDEGKAWFVTLTVDNESAEALSTYKAVETKFKGLFSALQLKYGKVLYIRGIEFKNGAFHVHCIFVFADGKPKKTPFKEKVKKHWTFGEVCIKPVTDKQGLAHYLTKMKNEPINYMTGEVYMPVFPSGAHIISRSRSFELLTETVTFEPVEAVLQAMDSGEYQNFRKQHKHNGKTCLEAVYMHKVIK